MKPRQDFRNCDSAAIGPTVKEGKRTAELAAIVGESRDMSMSKQFLGGEVCFWSLKKKDRLVFKAIGTGDRVCTDAL